MHVGKTVRQMNVDVQSTFLTVTEMIQWNARIKKTANIAKYRQSQ